MAHSIHLLFTKDKIQQTRKYIFEQHADLQISDKAAKELLSLLEKINKDIVNYELS